jgi:hypothetical protein
VVDRLSSDLRREFSRMTGLSPRNLDYVLQFAATFTEPILPQAVAKLPWGHIRERLSPRGTGVPGFVRRIRTQPRAPPSRQASPWRISRGLRRCL